MLALVATALLAGAPGGRAPLPSRSREMMTTRVVVALGEEVPAARQENLFTLAFGAFDEVERDMNEWLPGSPLAQVNASAGKGPATAPASLCAVLERSLEGARRTRGLFDPSWAALRGLWRFSGDPPPRVPADEELKARCARVDFRKVKLSWEDGGQGCTVLLPEAGMQLGLGGLAKGFGVDEAVARLRRAGLRHFFVQAGGDLYLAGHNRGRPWRVGIRDPRGPPERSFATLEVTDAALSTSGDYERFFVEDGTRYHHIIDPRTCRPAMSSRSATVLAKSAVDAEFLTKSVFILGGKEGLALAREWGAQAVIVGADNRVHVSPELTTKLRAGRPTP